LFRLNVIVLVFNCITLIAQQKNASVFSLKPSLGISGCQIHGDSYDGYDKLGFTGGAFINAKLTKKSSFELGFLYALKGSKHNPTNGDPSYYLLNISYVDAPLYWHFFLHPKYFITFGFYGSYLFNYNEYRDYTDVTGWYIYNKFDFGLVTGLGRKITENLHVELRFTNSLIPIRNINANTYYENPVARFFNKGYYNNVLTFMFAYKLDLNKTRAN
jgi:hypothetical protein